MCEIVIYESGQVQPLTTQLDLLHHFIYMYIQCTPYIIQCTPYTIHCTPYIIQCTPYTIQCTPYIIQCTPNTIHYTLYTIQCTPYTISCTPHTKQCTPYSVPHKTPTHKNLSLIWAKTSFSSQFSNQQQIFRLKNLLRIMIKRNFF